MASRMTASAPPGTRPAWSRVRTSSIGATVVLESTRAPPPATSGAYSGARTSDCAIVSRAASYAV
eukprot:259900-Prymnesium_polylepis.1